jgi:hypothetical protein
VVVGLHEVAQILQIPVREDTVGIIGLELRRQFLEIDAGDHRPAARKLLGEARSGRIPSAVAG